MIYRKAKITDVEPIHALITYYADRGLMLARSRAMLYESLRELTIAEEQGMVIGAGALNIIWEDLAEIRALAVAPEYAGRGIGRNLVKAFIDETRELAIPRVFALTYQQAFFEKCGFQIVAKESLPQKVWKECVNCPKFPNCEEVAMIIDTRNQDR
ncbi:N-acetyltransferase [Pelotomaculum terephthalicicum JT]|uniref:N-acetyltransferase n=1 Tax=Pelotomaculum TaxID=191373 RepID=UPI0009C65422|nr:MULTISPECIES: N-acetyltransferase [Pelotomaculum]MCG9969073.1 N-acetyltransferase [Pelotomaculum terephthalicicum JT]OPX87407.1 MAG: Amino-acid acetyltransferase [Pelotomaculum sp. PtaB.Bin117]OPY60898.1 MAG: Amino-acid acetyltransferase [Pelotomaculum sp. PtaU1.Bin065]